MTVSDLSNLRETRTTTVQGVRFDVESRAQWVSDQSGNISCRAGLARADYMAVSSTVTWPDMRNIDPVRSDTIIAPANGTFGPNQGSLAVEIKDRAGRGVPSLDVRLDGPEQQSDATNADGCVLWGYLESGDYTISFARQGWVDPQGVTDVTKPTDVPSMAVSTAAFDYDEAATVDVGVDTRLGSNPPERATAEYVSVAHSSLAPPGTRVFGSGSSSSSYTLSSLFPFTSSYSVYSGNCQGANPLNYGQSPRHARAGRPPEHDGPRAGGERDRAQRLGPDPLRRQRDVHRRWHQAAAGTLRPGPRTRRAGCPQTSGPRDPLRASTTSARASARAGDRARRAEHDPGRDERRHRRCPERRHGLSMTRLLDRLRAEQGLHAHRADGRPGVGLIVMLVDVALIDLGSTDSDRVADRTDASQRGRIAHGAAHPIAALAGLLRRDRPG